MNWLDYKNISKIIMTTTILIILSNTLLISLFYYKNQISNYKDALETLKFENLQKQKMELKDSIDNIISMIEFKYTKEQLSNLKIENDIKQWIKTLPFNKEKSNYLFVYKLVNKNGGDEFAKMFINPNRPDIEGKYISTTYKDINGFQFRKKFLEDINKKGDSYVRYSYKKTNGNIDSKISYFKYYKPLNWIIAKGIYDKDIQQDISSKRILLKKAISKQIKQNIILFLLFSLIAIIIAYFIGKKIKKIILEKDKKVERSTKQLELFNRDLDIKIKLEVEKNKKQTDILMQKSKFIALGETISLIAHQWRQPISELNAIILNMKLHHKLNQLDNGMIKNKTNEIESILDYMSNTIDDFRTFFKPNKQKKEFNFFESCKRISEISSSMLEEHQIKIVTHIDKRITLYNYQNELEQVVLNLITNAKDALVSNNISNPTIHTALYKTDKIYLEISDNANGIDSKIIDKIFDPYFTTKEEANGTGIGLYMSKMIIEENMGGKLEVDSDENGTKFIISFE